MKEERRQKKIISLNVFFKWHSFYRQARATDFIALNLKTLYSKWTIKLIGIP